MKYLIVDMPDGNRWAVSAQVIARNCTEYYAKREGFAEGSNDWKEAWDRVYDHDHILMDWAENNMDWSDVKGAAFLLPGHLPPPCDYRDGWVNGRKEVKDV